VKLIPTEKEAYSNNLYAGKILHDAGVPVAYKSVSETPCILWHLTDHYRTIPF